MSKSKSGRVLAGSVLAAGAVMAAAGGAEAGGFAVREQSASLLGSAFAGAAAGVDLSSAFWNPASFGIAQNGLSSESHMSVIMADTELSNGTTSLGPIGATETDIDKVGFLSAGYYAYRLNDQLVLGVTTGAPFGLATDPDDDDWTGRLHGREASMFSFNVTPTVAYEIAPGVHIAAGLQLQYLKLKIWQSAGFAAGSPNASLKLDDEIGVGATAGILLKPNDSTSIGIGFRSSIEHNLEGDFHALGVSRSIQADLELPETVTVSVMQAIMPGTRLLGTFEWSNWSRLDQVAIDGIGAVLDAGWDDGWFLSGGLEYDYSQQLTLRTGVAFERSPIREATQRLVQLPDSDRVWASIGATYHYSEKTTFDVGYSHIFFDDAHLTRDVLGGGPLILDADVENSANIFSVGMKTRW